jgi:NADH-quinone oxidoreductase subunit C
MTNEALKQSLSAVLPSATFDETGEFLNVLTTAADLRMLMEVLFSREEFQFDSLFCLTCVDWKTHFTMVYHLLSRKHKHQLVVKAKIQDIAHPEIATVCDLWKTANFHEREVYDMFGVKFTNHPDMRRILLEDDWEGFPLRKNYVDENMIAL